jgi:predicted nucleotidyltransferase
VTASDARREAMLASLKKAAAALRDADVPFALGGGFAGWARGASVDDHDVDLLIRAADVERALTAVAECGMRTERPPEGWLVKAFEGDVMIDLIHSPAGMEVDDALLARAEQRNVDGMPMPVVHPDDLLVSKLLALGEHSLDLQALVDIGRALREQVDWGEVAARTESSPYARAFLYLARELGIAPP